MEAYVQCIWSILKVYFTLVREAMSLTCTQSPSFVQLLQFHHCLALSFIFPITFVSCHVCFNWNLLDVSHECSGVNDTYGIYHWKILSSSYRRLAWAGFEPTTTEFHSDALTNWAIRPWVHFALRANFVQLI